MNGGTDPTFITWPEQPTYKTLTLTSLLDDPEKYLFVKGSLRINIDIDITYEEANFIKEIFTQIYKLREFALMPSKDSEHEDGETIGAIQFKSVDQIVITHLQEIRSDTFDSSILVAIYNSL